MAAALATSNTPHYSELFVLLEIVKQHQERLDNAHYRFSITLIDCNKLHNYENVIIKI